jgi:hypothetical protein
MIGMPNHSKELSIDQTHFNIMSKKAVNGGFAYGFVPLTKEDF